jgi:hypothetical protein
MDDFDNLRACLVACVKAAGGSKSVGTRLWPEKGVDAAARHLLNCLDEGRAERLTPDQVLYVAGLARAAGCHAYMDYCSRRLHYQQPVPREPAQELAELQRAFVEAAAGQAALASRIMAMMERRPDLGALKAVG